jgi:IclR family KDG regulon transcriptional repressor
MIKKTINNQSLERALAILCAFLGEKHEMSLKELSLATSLSKSTVYRLCVTLIQFEFLKRDETSGKYSLGMKLFVLGGTLLSAFSLREAAAPHLSRLRNITGESVFI